MSKIVTIASNEKKELEDPTGLEKQLQKSYVGAAWIPIDSISVSKELIIPTLAGVMIPADGRGGVETTPPSDLIFNG